MEPRLNIRLILHLMFLLTILTTVIYVM